MPIEFRCSECNQLLRTGEDTAGRQAKCPECGAIMNIPSPGTVPEGPPAPAPQDASDSPFGAGSPGLSSPFDASGGMGDPPPSDPTNPYQSPAAEIPAPGTISAGLRAYALARVSTPATLLVVFGCLAIPVAVLGTISNIIAFNMQGAGFPNPVFDQFFQQDPAFMVGTQVVSAVVSVGVGILMIIGGLKMKKLEGYGLCLATSIVAIIPCFTPCCCLEIPFGIWALVVLLDSQVSAAFRQQ